MDFSHQQNDKVDPKFVSPAGTSRSHVSSPYGLQIKDNGSFSNFLNPKFPHSQPGTPAAYANSINFGNIKDSFKSNSNDEQHTPTKKPDSVL